jgi:electron transfer flavoprotein beta subunit
MLLAVCLKQVVTRESAIRIAASGTAIDDSRASWELNEPDAYALEAALRLRDQHGGEVLAVSAGPDRVVQVLREALARGADRALHVAGDWLAAADAAGTASALAAGLGRERVDLVLTGLQSDDQGFGQVGVSLAELLGLPHATIVMAVEVAPEGLRVKRELEGGWSQWVRLPLPALLTVQSGINQLRYATLKGIMAARKKTVETVQAPPAAPGLRVVRIHAPERAERARMLSGSPAEAAQALVRALRDEARVL